MPDCALFGRWGRRGVVVVIAVAAAAADAADADAVLLTDAFIRPL